MPDENVLQRQHKLFFDFFRVVSCISWISVF